MDVMDLIAKRDSLELVSKSDVNSTETDDGKDRMQSLTIEQLFKRSVEVIMSWGKKAETVEARMANIERNAKGADCSNPGIS
jgi:hypothetical protein